MRHFATALHDWQMVNLIWRFMAMVGFACDALAIWYVVYLCQGLNASRTAREAADR